MRIPKGRHVDHAWFGSKCGRYELAFLYANCMGRSFGKGIKENAIAALVMCQNAMQQRGSYLPIGAGWMVDGSNGFRKGITEWETEEAETLTEKTPKSAVTAMCFYHMTAVCRLIYCLKENWMAVGCFTS